MTQKIYTSADAAAIRAQAEYLRELVAMRKDMKARLARAKRRAAQFQGAVHHDTVTRLQDKLAQVSA